MKMPHTGFEGSVFDHEFRSGYIQWLFHQETTKNYSEPKIPKVVIQFWDDLENLPKDVKGCLESWKLLEGFDFDVVLFSDISARNFIKKEYSNEYLMAYEKCNHPAMKCDYFRLCYIYKYGSAYIDADEILIDYIKFIEYFNNNNLKIQPLCFDLDKNKMVSLTDFIYDKSYPDKKIFYVNNNPIISPPKHRLIKLALINATNNLLEHKGTKFDIQSTVGPGNLTLNLVTYSMQLKRKKESSDFEIVKNWDKVSKCEWFLEYRNDKRNWRNY